jgi:hypothetical protein
MFRRRMLEGCLIVQELWTTLLGHWEAARTESEYCLSVLSDEVLTLAGHHPDLPRSSLRAESPDQSEPNPKMIARSVGEGQHALLSET